MTHDPRRATVVVAALVLCLAAPAALAGYETPPEVIRDIIEAPPTPFVDISPDHSTMLLLTRPNLISIDDLSRPEMRLAGRRLRDDFGPSRLRPYSELTLKSMDDLTEQPLSGLPAGARMAYVSWSPDSAHMAFAVRRDGRFELWTADTATAKARRLTDLRLNATAGNPIRWLSDSKHLLISTVPANHGPEPKTGQATDGPAIQESEGKAAPARTYQDLLKNAHDEAMFDHYTTAQLVRVSVDGTKKTLGRPQVMAGFDPSPDGRFILVERYHRPYSYIVPASRFPRKVEIWDVDGKVVREIADIPLKDAVPTAFGSVPDGPRSFDWRADAPATLVWAEAQDGGDARKKVDIRDKVFMLPAPFDGDRVPLAELSLRYGGVEWGNDDLALVSAWWWKTRQVHVWAVRPGSPSEAPDLLFDYSYEDSYADPGNAMTTDNEWGWPVLVTDAKSRSIFLIGDGASPEGNRPFLDRMDVKTKKKERLFRSEAPHYERPVAFLDEKRTTLVTRRESKTDPPNYYARAVKKDDLRQLTEFPHPAPQLAELQKELVKYQREDGVDLNATLYLPPGYEQGKDGKLPVVMWAYPREFKSADAAGQITDSPYRFDRVSWASPLLFLTMGYAVMDGATMPIIGEGDEEPNDTYVEQLVASAKAAIDEVDRRGVGDRDRVAIGGHSYGAFMTANLLAHSDLFKAGIARSGAYNRTLTPFGFQAEERTFWEAPDIYFGMSPFMHADDIDEPILMIHGEADNNSGTFPMQSQRLYAALKGLGGKARLVMLPHESHGYRARESILHMWWEQVQWLDRHVKRPGIDGAVGSP